MHRLWIPTVAAYFSSTLPLGYACDRCLSTKRMIPVCPCPLVISLPMAASKKHVVLISCSFGGGIRCPWHPMETFVLGSSKHFFCPKRVIPSDFPVLERERPYVRSTVKTMIVGGIHVHSVELFCYVPVKNHLDILRTTWMHSSGTYKIDYRWVHT